MKRASICYYQSLWLKNLISGPLTATCGRGPTSQWIRDEGVISDGRGDTVSASHVPHEGEIGTVSAPREPGRPLWGLIQPTVCPVQPQQHFKHTGVSW